MLQVVYRKDKWQIFDDEHQEFAPLAFASNAEAWAWVDQHNEEAQAMEERKQRIREALSR